MIKPTGLLLDTISDNTGDKAIRMALEAYFLRNGIYYEVLDPRGFEAADYSRVVVGGGHLIRDRDNGFYDTFRVPGRHILNGVGVTTTQDLGYLREYAYVSVRSKADQRRLEAVGIESRVVPCPSIAFEPVEKVTAAYKGHVGVEFAYGIEDNFPDLEAVLKRIRSPKVFIPFMHYGNDLQAMLPTAKKLQAPVLDALSPGELFSIISGLRCLITASLHAAIFAYVNNVPFIAFNIEKIREFCADRDLSRFVVTNGEEMTTVLAEILDSPPDYRELLRQDKAALEAHFQRLKQILTDGRHQALLPSPSSALEELEPPGLVPNSTPGHLQSRVESLQKRLQERDFRAARALRQQARAFELDLMRLRVQSEVVQGDPYVPQAEGGHTFMELSGAEAELELWREYARRLEQELAGIHSRPGFQTLEAARRIVSRWAPWGTRRSSAIGLAVLAAVYLLNSAQRAPLKYLLQPWKRLTSRAPGRSKLPRS